MTRRYEATGREEMGPQQGRNDMGEQVRSDDTLEEILSSVREALDMDVAFVSEFDKGQMVFRVLEGDADSFGWEKDQSIPLEASYCKRVIDGRLPGVIPDAKENEETKNLWVTQDADIGSYVGISLKLSDGKVYGTLCCLSHAPDPWLRDRDLQLMEKVAQRTVEQLERKGMI